MLGHGRGSTAAPRSFLNLAMPTALNRSGELRLHVKGAMSRLPDPGHGTAAFTVW